jgi:predicted metalloprotease
MGGGIGAVVIAVLFALMGGDPSALLGGGGTATAPNPEEDRLFEFVKVVLKTTEDVWDEQFRKMGKTYRHPKLVVFRGGVQSACGSASSAVGPFYCPGDQTVYIDLSFYETLRSRLGAGGDFAQAYVIAHEVGHHVQNLLGATRAVDEARGTKSENRMSVKLELQADFYAGVWAHHARRKNLVEEGDYEEAMTAASAIGDDTLQRKSQGQVVPDSFTHGSSAQRMAWFRRGFETGDPLAGNTFDDRLFDSVSR